MRLILLLLLPFLLAGCGGSSTASSEEAEAPNDEQRAAIESRLIVELSPDDDRPGKERNALINFAIDELWDVIPDTSGYFYQIVQAGEGVSLMYNDQVSLHYRGRFLDGTVFDDSRQRGNPIVFRVGQMIPAWNLSLPKIAPGGQLRLLVPSALGYGAEGLVSGRGDTLVGAHQPLIFEIDRVAVQERALEDEW